MGWASKHIERLSYGETIQIRPHGKSMSGKIESGDLVTIEPITETTELEVGHMVLCSVSGNQYVHLITAIGQDGRYQISNNKGHINGWTKSVYGKVIDVKSGQKKSDKLP